jgi:hypothetical protein
VAVICGEAEAQAEGRGRRRTWLVGGARRGGFYEQRKKVWSGGRRWRHSSGPQHPGEICLFATYYFDL